MAWHGVAQPYKYSTAKPGSLLGTAWHSVAEHSTAGMVPQNMSSLHGMAWHSTAGMASLSLGSLLSMAQQGTDLQVQCH